MNKKILYLIGLISFGSLDTNCMSGKESNINKENKIAELNEKENELKRALNKIKTIKLENELIESIEAYQPLNYKDSWLYSDKPLNKIKDLIKEGANNNYEINSISNTTPILTLIERYEDIKDSNSFEEIFNLLTENKVSINILNEEGENALIACFNKNLPEKFILSLIKSGADINKQQWDNETLLMLASEKGFVETVKILIESGANVNAKNKKNNYMVIHYALKNPEKNSREKIIDLINNKKKQQVNK